MGSASFAVTNFTGGELCQYVQGNFTEPVYKTGLNACSNALPIEEGAWVRRPGTQFAGVTRRGLFGRVIGFDVVASAPYDIELTAGFLRIWQGQSLAPAEASVNVTSISTANPAVLIPGSARTWNTGDTIVVTLTAGNTNYTAMQYLATRQFVVTKIDTTHFSLADQFGVTLDGSKFALGSTVATVAKVLEIATPWDDQTKISNVRIAQSENQILMFCYQVQTQMFTVDTSVTPQFTLAAAAFSDGPYLDPPKDGSSVQASGTSGTVTLTFSADQGLVEGSEGQFVRLLSEPPKWVSGHAYVPGDKTRYLGTYYNCIVATSTTNPPDTTPASQAIDPTAAQWCYATILEVASGTSTTATLANIPQPPGPNIVIPLGNPLLYTHDGTNPITTYRMGAYWGTKWPQCGTFDEGRFWFAGAITNRADAAMANNGLVCSPTFYEGTPADDCGVTAVFNFPEQMQINWMLPVASGIVAGCLSGEVLIRASQLGDPITPTSIQAKQVTRYGSDKVDPVHVGFSALFVNRFGKKLLDLTANVFSQRISATNVSVNGRHLTQPGLTEIRYQRELAPVLWARTPNGIGNWIGMTYKREDGYGSTGPLFAGWHRHTHGSARYPVSIATGTVPGGATDTLCMMTNQPGVSFSDYNIGHIEFLTPIFQEGQSTLCAWQLDGAIVPVSAFITGTTSVTFYGLWHVLGRTVTAYIGGLDCGDYVVAADGSIVVPFGAYGGLLTPAYLATIAGTTTCNLANLTSNLNLPASLPNPTILSMGTVSPNKDWACADWTNRRFFTMTGAGTGATVYSLDTGAVIASQTTTPCVSVGALDGSGNLYSIQGLSNATILSKFTGSTLALAGTFGATSGSFTDPVTQLALPNGNLTGLKCDANYILACGTTATAQVQIINADTMQFAGYCSGFEGSDFFHLVGAGPQSSASATAYVFSYKSGYSTGVVLRSLTILAGAAGYVPGTWPVVNSYITLSGIITTLLPAAVDATWTTFANVFGPLYDGTDGNILLTCYTNDAVTNKKYIVKLNSATGAVMWVRAVGDTFRNLLGGQLANTRVNYGVLAYYGTNGTVDIINTVTGALTTTVAITGISPVDGDVASDDTTGDIMVYGSYTAGGGAPVPIGSTPNSYSSLWGRLDLAGLVAVGQQSRLGNQQIPVVIGFRYTSKGQLLRQQSPETSGARNGPAMGKTRRTHRASAYFVNAISGDVSFGTDFVTMYPQSLSVNGESRTVLQPFTGISRLELTDDYSFDSMIAWKTSSAYPLAIAAVEGFLETQDL